MSPKRAISCVAVLIALSSACSGVGSESGSTEDAAVLDAEPQPNCASDARAYDGLRHYLADVAVDEAWINRVRVCAGGTVQVDQTGEPEGEAGREAIAVCSVVAGYLITKPPPAERAGAPNAQEVGLIVTNQDGEPIAVGSGNELAPRGGDAEREREHATSHDGEAVGGDAVAREPEPFVCFDPFA